ncbi:hypothetical protein M406DRAFT_352603 [Cryphonectria parasitica EP155]|uniref:Uncharacterized protein n=1 Tax=Cryphonectria parasitica (strain ATCC 38755 / EP155) TaxID=660469 RepID=A0A9P5CLC9_CRYP1|nr:uncharacterized protein M406DRAFT_352603 [Cryphonectria parasitica EP155]KAF3762092.1 hypothetical protein M406DRAFT_352603 [Cryphonectria parasitica EP155]
MHSNSVLFGLSAVANLASATATVRTLYQGNGSTTWVENLRVRSNGNVLATQIGPPANLLSFDPSQEDPEAVLISTFPSILGLSGITEVSHDVFYITGANTTGSNISDPPKNATKVWKVDFNQGDGNNPAIELIAEPVLPLVTDFNGLTTFNETIILASATFQDTVVAMNVDTGDYWTAFEDSLMSSINGIKAAADGYLYWTGSSGLARAPLYDNLTLGTAELIYDGSYDDFAISYNGFALAQNGTRYAYMASNEDTIQQLVFNDVTGNVSSASDVAGTTNATEWGKSTGCDFGRTTWQKNKVYCTTGGVLTTGSTVGGQVFEITVY